MHTSPSGEHGRHMLGRACAVGSDVLSCGPWRVRERFERRQSLDRPVEPSGQAVADDGESTREREFRVSEGGREHDRCTGVVVLGRKVDTMCVWLIDSMSVE